ncbi:MAG: MFS transporter [Chthoniobacteraceae bacterium]
MPDTPPTPALPERVLLRSMRLNIAAGSVGMFWVAVAYGMPLPLFMEAIGASGQQLGAVGAVRQLAMLGQIPAALFVERMARRKPFWAGACALHRLMWAVPALLPLLLPGRMEWWPVAIIVALALSDILSNLGSAPWMSWMADLLPAERSGRFWGVRQGVFSIALIFAFIFYGKLLDHFPGSGGLRGFSIVFGIGALAGLGDVLIHWWVHEPAPLPHPRREPVWERVVAPMRDPVFRRLTFALGAWSCAAAMPGIANGLPGFFNVVYLKQNFGATYSQASLLLVASAFGSILTARRIGQLIDRHGARRVIVWLMLAGSATSLAWFFVSPARVDFTLPLLGPQSIPQAVLLMSIASISIGGFYSGILLCQYRLSQIHTAPEGRTVTMAVHWSLVGLMSSIGPLLAGFIKDHFPAALSRITLPLGAPLSYFQIIIVIQVALIWLVAAPLLRRE